MYYIKCGLRLKISYAEPICFRTKTMKKDIYACIYSYVHIYLLLINGCLFYVNKWHFCGQNDQNGAWNVLIKFCHFVMVYASKKYLSLLEYIAIYIKKMLDASLLTVP